MRQIDAPNSKLVSKWRAVSTYLTPSLNSVNGSTNAPLYGVGIKTWEECQALCVAHPDCRYMNYVEPVLPTSGCSIWADCGVLCITDHCWHWWVTYIYEARPGPAWNVTACDALPEGPPPPPGPQAVAAAVTKHIGIP